MYVGKERRQNPRYTVGGMTANISFHDEASGNLCFERVHPMDFNMTGVSIETNLDLIPKSTVSIDISKDNIHVRNLVSTVVYVMHHANKKRYGLLFDFSANEYMGSEEVEQALSSIEHALKKNQKQTHRGLYRRIRSSFK